MEVLDTVYMRDEFDEFVVLARGGKMMEGAP